MDTNFNFLTDQQARQFLREELAKFFSENPPATSPKETGKTAFNIDEFCDYTGLSKQTVYKKTGKGLIPHSKRGKRLYFDKLKVDAWLLENSVRPLSEIESTADRYLMGRKRKGGRPC
ncbi:MAG: helix-turn-helix domain-containing protein [Lewinellaceae bacterium]|nr:helix-turn-helix domain-containing protein [Lewinellaceae bacterium]